MTAAPPAAHLKLGFWGRLECRVGALAESNQGKREMGGRWGSRPTPSPNLLGLPETCLAGCERGLRPHPITSPATAKQTPAHTICHRRFPTAKSLSRRQLNVPTLGLARFTCPSTLIHPHPPSSSAAAPFTHSCASGHRTQAQTCSPSHQSLPASTYPFQTNAWPRSTLHPGIVAFSSTALAFLS